MCLKPIKARLKTIESKKQNRIVEMGGIEFHPDGDLRLPCGKCTECLSKRALDWALRVKHEISCHDDNCFITLTYNDENLPNPINLKHNFKVFMDKLRKHLKRSVRYIVSHEYGSKTGRPHHHAIIFGWNPSPQKFLKHTKKGEAIYTSPQLESLWNKGHSSIGTANEKTAYYIADYSLKGGTFQQTCPHTGELLTFSDSMDCSKRPAIGLAYFRKNYEQLLNASEPLPRYYIKKLKDLNPTLHERYENTRTEKFKLRSRSELFAKYTIDQQKIKNSTPELRSTPEDSLQESAYKDILKTNRDVEHHIKKEEKK